MSSGPNQTAIGSGRVKNAVIFVAVSILLAQFAWRADNSLRQKSPVWDEFLHVDYGVNLLLRGPEFEAKDHPYPAASLLAFPLLFSRSDQEIASGHPVEMENPRNLMGPRRMNVGVATLCLLLFSLWVSRRFGSLTGILTLAVGCLDPNWLAQSRFITTDIALAAGFALGTAAIVEHAEKREARMMVLAIFGLLLALCSKFSGFLLIPSAFLIYVFVGRKKNPEKAWSHCLASSLYPTALIALIGGTAYLLLFEISGLLASAEPGRGIHHLSKGIQHFMEVRSGGHGTFLLGSYHENGSLLYFPILILSKTPVALLGICILAPLLPDSRRSITSVGRLWVAPLLYLSVAILSHVNLGFRHLTPIFPFLWLFCALALRPLTTQLDGGRWKAGLLLAVLALESVLAHPHYLPFTNSAFGGQEAAHTVAVDSASDWGQDLPALKNYLNAHPPKKGPIHLSYFGTGDPRKFGISFVWRSCGPLGFQKPRLNESAPSDAPAEVLAISATCLRGVTGGDSQDNSYAWLRSREPETILGGSILVFRDIVP